MIALTEQEKRELKDVYGRIIGTLKGITPTTLEEWRAEQAALAAEAAKPKFSWKWLIVGGIVLAVGYSVLKKK